MWLFLQKDRCFLFFLSSIIFKFTAVMQPDFTNCPFNPVVSSVF